MYPTLYLARQKQGEYLPRQWYYDDALALPWVRTITIKRTPALNRQAARGLIYSSNCQTHGGLESFDYTVILADGMPIESERFVTIKELMHCYFAPIETNIKYLTGTEIALETHMNVFFGSSTAQSAPSRAEKMALWMAVGVICTEHDRKTILAAIRAKTLTPQEIAQKMQIPVKQAKNLLSTVYESEIARLIS